jgi:anaphase-promoting complex subunit 6
LYYIAHKLVSADPDSVISWFAVGCYYFLIKKFDLARKYFAKCNKMERNFAPGWTAFGHAFAA